MMFVVISKQTNLLFWKKTYFLQIHINKLIGLLVMAKYRFLLYEYNIKFNSKTILNKIRFY